MHTRSPHGQGIGVICQPAASSQSTFTVEQPSPNVPVVPVTGQAPPAAAPAKRAGAAVLCQPSGSAIRRDGGEPRIHGAP